MTYRIAGLDPSLIDDLRGLSDAALVARGAVRRHADATPGFPCRVTLEDALAGEPLILFNHVCHDVAGPYRSSYAIYVRENARTAAVFEDELPPVMRTRTLSVRGFGADGMIVRAALSAPGEADAAIRAMFEHDAVAYTDIYNGAYGCFAGRATRS